MTPESRSTRARSSRALKTGVPVIAGSIALTLTAGPAHAVEPVAAPEAPVERAHGLGLRALMPAEARPSLAVRAGAADRSVGVRAAHGVGIRVAARALPASRATAETPPAAYTVQSGDSVSAVAGRFGLRTADVLALNGLSWESSTIRPGQVLVLVGSAPVAPAAPASPAPTTPAPAGYTVRGGDTVSAIAAAHGVSTQAVFDANGLGWSSVIYPGQALVIPGGSAPSAPAPVAPAAPASPPPGATYEVRSGDTVGRIAAAHGTSVQAMLDANGLGWSSIIYPGQLLTVPGAGTAAAVAVLPAEPVAAVTPLVGLDAEQSANAQLIIRVGRELGVSDHGIAIALGTAMQESWLRNLGWGDRDSLGLFQQRPSQGWGTAEEIRNPERSTRVFYGGASDPNGSRTRGLLDIPGWQDMGYADAAQAVQISAYPDRYAQWEAPARGWLSALG